MRFAITPAIFASLCLLVLQVSADTRPIPRLQCPDHQQPVCATDDAAIRLTLRNECAFASLSIQDGSVFRILHRGPCKEHKDRWSGWENDPDDIPANYEAYKKLHPNSTY